MVDLDLSIHRARGRQKVLRHLSVTEGVVAYMDSQFFQEEYVCITLSE